MSFGLGLQFGALLVALVGAVLGGLVQVLLPLPVRLGLLGLVAVAVLLREGGLVTLPVPENQRLVPEHVQHRGRLVGTIQFGFEMGTGMRTYSPSALPHLVLLAILLALPFHGALAAGAGFAAARWIMPAVSIGHGGDGAWEELWRAHRRLLAVGTALATATALATGIALTAW
ncbi:hypothetical protein [Actinomadura alba]|uniref:Uncharacterized protein n=1 Tax=Actinomadura alba TaxID=406431 RepID=A0ABR7LGI6_9ACTN|nr:hypothetical protein [Actinomadura alba]MBC6463954.1 hypothetical protein [Actinomadura alba]